MIQWYFRDGSPAVTVELEENPTLWKKQITKLNTLLGDRAYKVVKQETLPNGYLVSTVWLGLDQSFVFEAKHAPLIFETMVFPKHGNFHEQDMDRYTTEEEAIKGHQKMVRKWKKRKAFSFKEGHEQ